MARPAVAEINLKNIRANFKLASSLALDGKTLAVVKADAYGHGSVQVAKYLAPDAEVFAVASIEEAMILRASGIDQPILLLEGFFDAEELETISREGFWTAVHRQQQLEQIDSNAGTAKHSTAVVLQPKPHVFRLIASCVGLLENHQITP